MMRQPSSVGAAHVQLLIMTVNAPHQKTGLGKADKAEKGDIVLRLWHS
jgi:hypothetical protein